MMDDAGYISRHDSAIKAGLLNRCKQIITRRGGFIDVDAALAELFEEREAIIAQAMAHERWGEPRLKYSIVRTTATLRAYRVAQAHWARPSCLRESAVAPAASILVDLAGGHLYIGDRVVPLSEVAFSAGEDDHGRDILVPWQRLTHAAAKSITSQTPEERRAAASKGGLARAAKIRRKIANRKAAQARWRKKVAAAD